MHNKLFASHCLLHFQTLFCFFWTSKQDNGFIIFWNISLAWSGLAACRIVGLGDVWDSQTNHTVSGGYQQFQYFQWSFKLKTVLGEYNSSNIFHDLFQTTMSSANINSSNIFNDLLNLKLSLANITVPIFSMIFSKPQYLRQISTVQIFSMIFFKPHCLWRIWTVQIFLMVCYNHNFVVAINNSSNISLYKTFQVT